jgi:hypothetical protein
MDTVLRMAAVSVVALGVAGCVKPMPPPHDIPSSSVMQPSPENGLISYINPSADFSRYQTLYIEPVRIYMGSGGRFGATPIEEREQIARFMYSEFARAIDDQVQVVSDPDPGAMRLRLILVGLRGTESLMAASSHFSIGGMAMNLWRTLIGANGAFMGSVTYIAEFYDSAGDTLLAAFQTERSANALDISEDFSGLGSAKVGVIRGARHMRAALAALQAAQRY